ncbi:hypothetical protein FQN54_009229 [Arachnomyces sp. PD_36]|nr:hypothetical protein FQN54_009229 [Arachnomyces sp. PD_36]
MSTLVVPPGQSPPFEVIDSDHRGGVIVIVAACALVLSLVAVLIRVYVRLLLSPPFGLDDHVLLGATTVAIVQSVIVFWNVSIGFGTSIHLLDDDHIHRIQRNVAASDVLYLIAIYLSKSCTTGIYLRLTPRASHHYVLWATLALSTAWIITSTFVILTNCQLNGSWGIPIGQCPGLVSQATHQWDTKMIWRAKLDEQFPRWQFITALDIITEVLLFSFSLPLVAGLRMRFDRKFVIVLSFAARLPLIAFSPIRLYHFRSFIDSQNPTFKAIDHYIWTQVEMNYALAACIAFCLRPFMNAVRTNYGTAGDVTLSSSGTRSLGYTDLSKQSGTPNESFPMLPLRRKKKDKEKNSNNSESETKPSSSVVDQERARAGGLFRPRGAGLTVSTAAVEDTGQEEAHDGNSMGSDRSSRMIIRKDVQYAVRHSPRRRSDTPRF